MPRSRRTLAPFLLVLALFAALAFAATAAAETKIGEGTSPEEPSVYGEADLLKASAEFDVDTGTATFKITTRAASESIKKEERKNVLYLAALVTTKFECTKAAFEAAQEKASKEGATEFPVYPMLELISPNEPVTQAPFPGVEVAQAYSSYLTEQPAGGGIFGEELAPATKSQSGTTLTLSGTNVKAVKGAFTCGLVQIGGTENPEIILFPLTTKPEPPPVEPPVTPEAPKTEPAPQPPAPTKAAPAPAPGVLSLAKAKPQALKVGKLATVRVTVSNPGGSPTGQGFLTLRAPKGVVIQGRRQKLPALLPGDSWTLTYRVRLTARVTKRATIAISGTSGALTAGGSLVVVPKPG
jgi:hypothetical protein